MYEIKTIYYTCEPRFNYSANIIADDKFSDIIINK